MIREEISLEISKAIKVLKEKKFGDKIFAKDLIRTSYIIKCS